MIYSICRPDPFNLQLKSLHRLIKSKLPQYSVQGTPQTNPKHLPNSSTTPASITTQQEHQAAIMSCVTCGLSPQTCAHVLPQEPHSESSWNPACGYVTLWAPGTPCLISYLMKIRFPERLSLPLGKVLISFLQVFTQMSPSQ